MKEIPDTNRGRHFRWLFNLRTMRRVLIGVAGMLTLMAIIYARVNWHGQQEWDNCKREMVAKGEVWDWSVYAPASVPDDQNIFKAPRIAEWFGDNRGIMALPLDQRMTNDFARRLFSTNSTVEITDKALAAKYLSWSDQFQNDFDIIATALQRPSARIVANYSQPFLITLPNVATLHAVVKTTVQRAKCHLIVGQPEKAWQELTLLHNLRRMVEGQGKFITTEGDWLRRELARHSLQVIAKGLELHAWQGAQLIELQGRLADSDFISLHAEALKCARALLLSSMSTGDFLTAAFTASGNDFWTRLKKHPELLILKLAPRGSRYERAVSVSINFRNMINALTPPDGIIRPGDISKAFGKWKKAQEGLPALLRIQTLVNEAQIACALERYRIGHGEYPDRLDALVPQLIEKLPRDIINGKGLIYRRTEDGNFLIYSVGWNETDDGGNFVTTKGDLKQLTRGDWVWKNSLKPE